MTPPKKKPNPILVTAAVVGMVIPAVTALLAYSRVQYTVNSIAPQVAQNAIDNRKHDQYNVEIKRNRKDIEGLEGKVDEIRENSIQTNVIIRQLAEKEGILVPPEPNR